MKANEVRISEALYCRLEKKLDEYDWFCVRSNFDRCLTDGVDTVIGRLRQNGYPTIASAVHDIWKEVTNNGER